jgi:hypothetical protein
MQLLFRQRIGKHIPAATNTRATIQLLLETVFYTQSVQKGYKEDNRDDPVSWELNSAREAEKRWRYSSVDSELTEDSALEAAKIEPERVKLKNLHC